MRPGRTRGSGCPTQGAETKESLAPSPTRDPLGWPTQHHHQGHHHRWAGPREGHHPAPGVYRPSANCSLRKRWRRSSTSARGHGPRECSPYQGGRGRPDPSTHHFQHVHTYTHTHLSPLHLHLSAHHSLHCIWNTSPQRFHHTGFQLSTTPKSVYVSHANQSYFTIHHNEVVTCITSTQKSILSYNTYSSP